jgi:hypothetical protein
MDAKHIVIIIMFEEEINSLLKGSVERQPTKKRTIVFGGLISNFFLSKIPSKEKMCHRIFL